MYALNGRGDILARDLHVQEHDVGTLFGGPLQGRSAVLCLADDDHVILRLKDLSQTLSEESVVIDDQNRRHVSRLGH